MIRDLHSTMEREKAPIGVFRTKSPPAAAMEKEAPAVGRFHVDATDRSYPRLQILTLAEPFAGRKPDIPLVDPGRHSGKRCARIGGCRAACCRRRPATGTMHAQPRSAGRTNRSGAFRRPVRRRGGSLCHDRPDRQSPVIVLARQRGVAVRHVKMDAADRAIGCARGEAAFLRLAPREILPIAWRSDFIGHDVLLPRQMEHPFSRDSPLGTRCDDSLYHPGEEES
jgi:hypothetical protein